jgi:hypothetical protein
MGIALIAASVVTGCRGGHAATLADGPDPVVPHGSRADVPRHRQHAGQRRELTPRAPAIRHRQRAARPGCTRVAGGIQCVSTRGVDRDWVINDGDDQDPTRSLVDPGD